MQIGLLIAPPENIHTDRIQNQTSHALTADKKVLSFETENHLLVPGVLDQLVDPIYIGDQQRRTPNEQLNQQSEQTRHNEKVSVGLNCNMPSRLSISI